MPCRVYFRARLLCADVERDRSPTIGGTLYRAMEFLTFIVIFASAWLLWRRPERERLALQLLVVSILLMIFIFTLGTRTSILPGLNY